MWKKKKKPFHGPVKSESTGKTLAQTRKQQEECRQSVVGRWKRKGGEKSYSGIHALADPRTKFPKPARSISN